MSLITISRMFGSGGSEVAAGVANALGWQLLDNAFVDAVAQRLGVSPEEVEEREERVPSLTQRLATTLAISAPEILPSPIAPPLPPTEQRLVEVTARIVQEAVATGHAVLVGRGAQCILGERADVLHIFCYAPRDALAARVAARLGISIPDAAREVEQRNHQREQYVRRYWKRSWLAFDNYHLCINTGAMGIDETVALVVRVACERFALTP